MAFFNADLYTMKQFANGRPIDKKQPSIQFNISLSEMRTLNYTTAIVIDSILFKLVATSIL